MITKANIQVWNLINKAIHEELGQSAELLSIELLDLNALKVAVKGLTSDNQMCDSVISCYSDLSRESYLVKFADGIVVATVDELNKEVQLNDFGRDYLDLAHLTMAAI